MSKTSFKLSIAISALLICSITFLLHAGYGDCIDTVPSALEREVHVMTNAVRMDPTGFRDLYISGTNILLPENYPSVAPLWYNNDLSRAARFHSLDMANTCGMQHESCDKTSFGDRIRSYYTKGFEIAENVATGNATGLKTVIQWLRDDNMQKIPAIDKTDGAGHRENIMYHKYNEMGIGYGYSASRSFNHFWTQDLGNGKPSQYYKIPAGCHFKPNSSTLSYAVNYYDQSGIAPRSAAVCIDSDSYPMALHLGTTNKGTYIYSTANDKNVHCYYFQFVDGNGDTVRFPETMTLTTGSQLYCEEKVNTPVFKFSEDRNNGNLSIGKSLYLLDGKIINETEHRKSSGISVKTKVNDTQREILIKNR